MSDLSEEELKVLLASLYKEPIKDENFEARFTASFHDRVLQGAICTSPSRRLWDAVCHFFAHMTMPKMVYSSMTLVALFTGVSSLSYFHGDTSPGHRARKGSPRLTHLQASLSDALGASITKMDEEHKMDDLALPPRLDIRVSPKADTRPNYTDIDVLHQSTHRVFVNDMTIHVERNEHDTTLNIKLIDSH